MSTTVGNLSVELGISDDQLRAGLAAAVVQAQQAGQAISQSMSRMQQEAERSARTGRAQAILNIGRSVQDFAAAGFMGVVNNVEGVTASVAKAMGKSSDAAAEMAGKFTLIAVAAQVGLPLVVKLVDSIEAGLGLAANNAERAANSVKGLMTGGLGGQARSEGIKLDAQFLMERDDTPTKWNYLSRQLGLAADGAEAFQRNLDRSVRATALVSEAMEISARAARDQRYLQRGSTAEFDLTSNRKEQTNLNKLLFQEVLDSMGGGQNLRTRIEMAARQQGINKSEARSIYGGFAEGDIAATAQVEQMLNLTAEKAKIMASDWERVTGAAAELRNIEEETRREAAAAFEQETDSIYKSIVEGADKAIAAQKSKDRLIGDEIAIMVKDELERQALTAKASEMESNLADLEARRMRSEIIGSSDVFMRNFNAGLEKDPTVLAIEKQTEDLKEVMESLKELN